MRSCPAGKSLLPLASRILRYDTLAHIREVLQHGMRVVNHALIGQALQRAASLLDRATKMLPSGTRIRVAKVEVGIVAAGDVHMPSLVFLLQHFQNEC